MRRFALEGLKSVLDHALNRMGAGLERDLMKQASAFVTFSLFTVLAGVTYAQPPAPELRPAEQGAVVLSWNQAQKVYGFGHMDKIFTSRTVHRGGRVRTLPSGAPMFFTIPVDGKALGIDAFMRTEHVAGLLVIQNGHVRLERYGKGFGKDWGPHGRWTSFSVAKSITSTLAGAALADGYITALDDPVTRYIPGLTGSAYDGVSVRQLMTMTSGVKWNEDYADPQSDVARLFNTPAEPGADLTVSYMRTLPREAAPGSKWVYKTGETELLGVLVAQATHKSLAEYLSEKIWKPWGMEADALWEIDSHGQEAGGCCLSMRLRDYGRFGLFVLADGRIGEKPVVPQGWFKAATQKQVDIGDPDTGYGYQWWTQADGSFDGLGIFGQMLHIDPRHKLIIVTLSASDSAVSTHWSKARRALTAAVIQALGD